MISRTRSERWKEGNREGEKLIKECYWLVTAVSSLSLILLQILRGNIKQTSELLLSSAGQENWGIHSCIFYPLVKFSLFLCISRSHLQVATEGCLRPQRRPRVNKAEEILSLKWDAATCMEPSTAAVLKSSGSRRCGTRHHDHLLQRCPYS